MSTDTQKYDELRSKYHNLLNSANNNKGDLRAFIGVRTWVHEAELVTSKSDKYDAHIEAFDTAIDELKESISKKSFDVLFKSSLDDWFKKDQFIEREAGGSPLIPPPIPSMSKWKANGLTLISLFSGAMGLDLGFMAAGFGLRFTNDISKDSEKTIIDNLPDVYFEPKDFAKVTSKEVLDKSGLKKGEVDLITGGPPCQPFSTAGKRQGLSDPRSSPLKEFIRVIKDIQPRAFVMEEVTGLLSARLKHIPISERDDRKLSPEEEKGSVFALVLKMLKSTGYNFTYKILNAADFGSPQVRNRIIIIGLREGEAKLPEPTHSETPQANLYGKVFSPWNSFWAATVDLQDGKDENESAKISANTQKYMRYVPPGGYWKHLPEDKIKEALGGAYSSNGGKMGYYRRLSWDEPSPTVVTSPIQKGTLFCHPESMRPLNIKEYKRIQGFPDDWKINGGMLNQYKLIGNAVPVHLSYAIANNVMALLKNN